MSAGLRSTPGRARVRVPYLKRRPEETPGSIWRGLLMSRVSGSSSQGCPGFSENSGRKIEADLARGTKTRRLSAGHTREARRAEALLHARLGAISKHAFPGSAGSPVFRPDALCPVVGSDRSEPETAGAIPRAGPGRTCTQYQAMAAVSPRPLCYRWPN